MPRLRSGFVLVLLLAASAVAAPRSGVILDADIDSDVDDVQALAMAHTLATRGVIDLLGVVATSDDPFAATCASALNHHFGRPELPIGVLKNQPQLKNHSRYTRQVTAEFPHALRSHEDAADATQLYRRLLAGAGDRSVIIVTIGHLTNLRNLLVSAPDGHSPLPGRVLVEQKVQRWICMGGMFPRGKEANFYRPDPASTVTCVGTWPRPVTFCGWEVGHRIQTGGAYLRQTLSTASPVYRAYQLYNDFRGRASWDQVAVLMLSPEAERSFDRVAGGVCHVFDDGSNEWRSGPASRHDYVVLKPGVAVETIGRLMDDLSRSPVGPRKD